MKNLFILLIVALTLQPNMEALESCSDCDSPFVELQYPESFVDPSTNIDCQNACYIQNNAANCCAVEIADNHLFVFNKDYVSVNPTMVLFQKYFFNSESNPSLYPFKRDVTLSGKRLYHPTPLII
ncbi:MAG: hypothetical protein HQ508_03565 [Candidatus Marinimicrobia bacterium]|nr:hypothetical protein [Candidatus Neomarinimicrobiota bacterium]